LGKENLSFGPGQVSMALPVKERVGMMECWNNDFKGIDNSTDPIIIKMFLALNPIIPLFQSSTIPMVSPGY